MTTEIECWKESPDGVFIEVAVTPKSSQSRVAGIAEGRLKVAVTAPPSDGQANLAVVNLVSRELKIPKTSIAIVRGEAGRQKRLLINAAYSDRALQYLRTLKTPTLKASKK